MAIGVGVTSKGTTTGATNVTTTGVATQASGSTIVLAVVTRSSGGGTFVSIADNKGNTYTIIGSQLATSSNAAWGRLYRCENAAGGSGHTATVTVSSSQEITLMFLEITGAAAASFDLTAQQADNASPFTSGATGTTNQAAELLVGFLAGTSGSNPATHAVSGSTPAAGSWTVQVTETDGSTLWTGCLATAVVAATGAYTAGFTESGNTTDSAVWIATFKEAAGGGGATLRKNSLMRLGVGR